MQPNEFGFYYPTSLIMDCQPSYHYAREPIIRKMPDESLFCVVLTGGPTEPHNDNVVVATRSQDDGRTWCTPYVLFQHSARGVWAPEIFTGGEVPCMFVHTYDAPTRYREITAFCSHTHDSGKTWTQPVGLPSGASHVSVRQGIILSNGSWLFPVYWMDVLSHWDWNAEPISNGFQRAWPSRCGALLTFDRGKSYHLRGDLRADDLLFENNVVETEPGHIVMLMRAHWAGYLYRSDSYDGGMTWTDARPTDIRHPSSKISLVKIKNAVVLLHNDNQWQGQTPSMSDRAPLSLWVSYDGMETWPTRKDLTPQNHAIFYPHCFADDERQILYIACEDGKRHYLLKLPYDTFLG